MRKTTTALAILLVSLLPFLSVLASGGGGGGEKYPNEHPLKKCAAEFEPCHFRDCCNDAGGDTDKELTCVTGGDNLAIINSFSLEAIRKHSNSTCLSQRSANLEALSKESQYELLREYYEERVPEGERKSTVQIQDLHQKHASQHGSFAKLVSRLELRYKIPFTDSVAVVEEEL